MERNKIKIVFGFGIFSIFFISAVLLLITNFVSRMLMILAMSNMNYTIDVSIVAEPILVILSIICFILSAVALIYSVSFLNKQWT